jgi:hypothetical protein
MRIYLGIFIRSGSCYAATNPLTLQEALQWAAEWRKAGVNSREATGRHGDVTNIKIGAWV